MSVAKFPLGRLVATPGALAQVSPHDINTALARHLEGDWGELGEEDRSANDRALIEGSRLVSAYHATNGIKFWIITEHDRSISTVLLPEDY